MREQVKHLTPESLLSVAKASGELFYNNGNDSLGIAEISTDSKSFDFIDTTEKVHAQILIQQLLTSNKIIQRSPTLYQLTENCYISDQPIKSKISDVLIGDILEIKPNFFGIGININALFRKLFRKRFQ